LLCFAEEATKGLLLASQTLFKISERYFKGLLLASQTLFKISERYFKGLLALLRWGTEGMQANPF
jgi:hypothetical protein